jgi:hypothetical protein
LNNATFLTARGSNAMSKQLEDLRQFAADPIRDAPDSNAVLQSIHSALAKQVLNSRRERARLFGAGLFADPAYDILLFLFIKRVLARW